MGQFQIAGWVRLHLPLTPSGKVVSAIERAQHAEEVRWFGRMIEGAEVRFLAFSYDQLLTTFSSSRAKEVQDHAQMIRARFDC